jgi:formylglycine-generating enzyme required for sulfatase activity/succinate dehydrogenase flavin-adding protein (antitoxin of CptAB toxin-antitoxin module)
MSSSSDDSPLPRSDDDSTRYRPANTPSTSGSTRFVFKLDDETDLVSPEERARWEGREDERPAINLRPVLSDRGRKGPVSGAQWPAHEIGDLLGEGGMAAVYLARRRDNGRLVALKILPARYADDAASRKRFEREAQIAQAIDSRHVVKVWSAGRYGPLCYLEMEYVDGTSLGDDLKRRREAADKPFTSDEVIDLALQAADGLQEAAKHHLVHRDIKPGNLMRTQSGVLKIADFGIVKVIGEEALTMAGTALGTPSYMSPEQGRGDQVDARADIYSLGVVLYELLTLKQPFEEATADALIYQHHFVEPKLITELVPACDGGLQAVVFKCLQKYPDRRYADAAQLIRDLNLLKGGCAPEVAVFPKNRITTGADEALARHGGGWRRWWKHALAGVAALVLVVALSVWWLLASRAQAEALRTRLAVLDTPQAIAVAAAAELQRLSGLVGERDAQVVRWTSKLAEVERLRTRLSAFPAGDLDQAQVVDAQAALNAYQQLCGTSEALVVDWRARLEAAQRTVREARTALAALDRSEVVPKDLLDRLRPALADARRLSSPTDAEVARWAGLYDAALKRLTDLRGRLVRLDAAEPLTVATQRAARDDHARWTALMGSADEDGIRWAARLQAAQEQVASLRQALRQLDAGGFASLAVAATLEKEWSTFSTLAEADDPDLLRWHTRLDQARARREELVRNLKALDGDTLIDQERYNQLVADMVNYRAIAGSDDAAAIRWQSRLIRLTQEHNTMRQVLASLMEKDQLSQEEQQLLRTTAERLRTLGMLPAADAKRVDERLARDAAVLVLLTERLALLDRQEDIDDSLRPLLEQFERLAALDDPRRAAWRRKLDEVVGLRRRLAALDERQPLAAEVGRDLERLTQLVGAAPADVRRWSDAVAAVLAHKQALATLDAVGPVDEGASERLERLRKLVGDTDADVQRWQARLDRVTILRGRLVGLDQSYVLPATASDDLRGLRALVGDSDALVQSAAERVRILEGPGRPAWASAYGRDEFGLFADLTVWQHTQRFRYIPAGSFTLGSRAEESGRDSDEAPVAVRLTRSLWLAETECVQGFWAQIMLSNPSFRVQAGHPVERVSWHDAQRLVALLAQRVPKGLPCRLPTEAEWEYAARAGASGRLPGHDAGSDDLDRMAVHAGNADGAARAVRGRQPNRLGLYDLLGNVWEWCQDTYAPYPLVPVVDPLANQGNKRVLRGGSWGDASSLLRVADRHALAPDVGSAYVGLRLAIDVEWSK